MKTLKLVLWGLLALAGMAFGYRYRRQLKAKGATAVKAVGDWLANTPKKEETEAS